MASRKMTKEEIEGWEKLYAKDLLIIGDFLKQSTPEIKVYRLFFKDGTQLIARWIGSSDSDNGLEPDDPFYEDLYELDFKVVKIEKKGSALNYKENECIALSYHNWFEKFEPYEGKI